MTFKLDKTPLRFGKYKGKTPIEVLEIEPSYLVWAYTTIVNFNTCSAELADQAYQKIQALKAAKENKGGKTEPKQDEKLLNQGIIMNPTYPISAEEAKALGHYEAEWYSTKQNKWFGCGPLCKFSDPTTVYRLAPMDHANRRISPKQASKLPASDVQVYTPFYGWVPVEPHHSFSEHVGYRLKPCNKKDDSLIDTISFMAFVSLTDSNTKAINSESDLHLPKGNTMSQILDSTIPVQTVTLVYGQNVKNMSDGTLMSFLRHIDSNIATYSKDGVGSARMEAKVAELKADRAAIIAAFDAANPVVGTAATATASDNA